MSRRRGSRNPGGKGKPLKSRVQDLARAVAKLPRWRQVAVGVMAVLVVLTWLAVCAIMASLFTG